MSKRALLDVDPSILERNLLTVPQEDEFTLDTLMPKPNEDTPSKMIRPTPGFCVKAKTFEDDKLFINVCQTDEIPPPNDISEGQLLEILSSDTASEFRVPMSIGEGRPTNDKSGNIAMAYDIAINKNFFDKMENCEIFKQFFLNVIFEGIENKFNIKINMQNFCILKNRKVMGSLQLHCIQDRDKNKTKNKKLIEEIKPKNNKKIPKYRIVSDKINDATYVFVDVFMPDLVAINDVRIESNEERIVVETMKSNYFLDIFLPIHINFKESVAQFNKNNGFLTIKAPVK